MNLVYPELRRIARQNLERHRAGDSLDSAALANEAYLKLVTRYDKSFWLSGM